MQLTAHKQRISKQQQKHALAYKHKNKRTAAHYVRFSTIANTTKHLLSVKFLRVVSNTTQ